MSLKALLLGMFVIFLASGAHAASNLSVENGQFIIMSGDRRLTSQDLVGAVLDIADGQGGVMQLRIDATAPAQERSQVLLHTFSIRTGPDQAWAPLCQPDAQGRRAGFPVAGAWRDGRFVADASQYFLTCTSGAQGKCILWGYDPWAVEKAGHSLAPYYEACNHLVRADYDGGGQGHTKDGTPIIIYDHIGVQNDEPDQADFRFESGWGPRGAVCVARTRWPQLLALPDLLAATPRLGGDCDEAAAARRGALVFSRVLVR